MDITPSQLGVEWWPELVAIQSEGTNHYEIIANWLRNGSVQLCWPSN